MSQNKLKTFLIKENISERLFFSIIIFLFTLAGLVFDQKLGLRASRKHSWVEIYENLPLFIVISAFFAIPFFFASDKNVFICSNCQEIHSKKKAHNMTCRKCGNQLEPLVGFYERNPHLKKKAEKRTESDY